jgi:hypothetical protein
MLRFCTELGVFFLALSSLAAALVGVQVLDNLRNDYELRGTPAERGGIVGGKYGKDSPDARCFTTKLAAVTAVTG